jgi:hypothetical protein
MIRNGRDIGIKSIRARKNHSCYGMGLGIIILDEVYPGFPGDVRNASTYTCPVQFQIVKGVNIDTLCYAEDKSPCLHPIIDAARELERYGCRAISAECGYFAYFQKEVAAAVDVPVFLSSLLQAPWARQVIGPDKVVGILAADTRVLNDHHLASVGIDPELNYVIGGAINGEKCPEFINLWLADQRPAIPCADYDKAARDFVNEGVAFYKAHPNMGAMVLECTGFPPFARQLQREIEIPVFSYTTLLDYAYSVCAHRDFYGHV